MFSLLFVCLFVLVEFLLFYSRSPDTRELPWDTREQRNVMSNIHLLSVQFTHRSSTGWIWSNRHSWLVLPLH